MKTQFHTKCLLLVSSILALNAAAESPSTEPQPQHFFLNMFVHTPIWVYALLGFLIFMGVLQSRARYIPLRAAFIIPVIMLVLSLSGIIMNFGVTLFALIGWALGVLMVQVLVLKMGGAESVKWQPELNKFLVRGSWWPLVIFIGIFAMRYTLGAGKAMHASFLSDPYWTFGFAFLSGSFSGFFLSRMWLYIKAKKSDVNRLGLV